MHLEGCRLLTTVEDCGSTDTATPQATQYLLSQVERHAEMRSCAGRLLFPVYSWHSLTCTKRKPVKRMQSYSSLRREGGVLPIQSSTLMRPLARATCALFQVPARSDRPCRSMRGLSAAQHCCYACCVLEPTRFRVAAPPMAASLPRRGYFFWKEHTGSQVCSFLPRSCART